MSELHPTTLGAILEYFRDDRAGFDAWWKRLREDERADLLDRLRHAHILEAAAILAALPIEETN